MTEQSDQFAHVQIEWGIRIALSDGVQLSATLYRPTLEKEKARPVIFVMTPYIAQICHEQALYFASEGFCFLTIDVRGRGNSDGEFVPFVNERSDGRDIVRWLAEQPFCNGRIAMWGGSYAGYTQWATAAACPEGLSTIAPVASPRFGIDFPARWNIFSPYLMQWLTLVWGRTSQDLVFWGKERYWGEQFRRWAVSGAALRDLDSQLGIPSIHFHSWLDHPCLDDYWDGLNPSEKEYAAITQPVLTITGMYDGDQPGALAHFRAHGEASKSEHYLVIGPWDHAGTRVPCQEFCGISTGPESLVDLKRLHLEWYRWTMADGQRPAFLKDKVAYYVMGADRWRYTPSLEAVTADVERLSLGSSTNPADLFGSGCLLTEEYGKGGPDHYCYDPADTSLAALEATIDPENRSDQRLLFARNGKHLVYHGSPYSDDREISGFFRLEAWLSIDQADTDFQAAIYDVGVDGRAVLLTKDWVRARYRKSLREAELVTTSDPLRYDFARFPFVSYLMKRGHRLRLIIGPIHSIYSEKNHNSGGVVAEETVSDAVPVRVELHHDENYPTALYVPYGSVAEASAGEDIFDPALIEAAKR